MVYTIKDISEAIAYAEEITPRQAAQFANDFVNFIKGAIENGDIVNIKGFGEFGYKTRKERQESVGTNWWAEGHPQCIIPYRPACSQPIFRYNNHLKSTVKENSMGNPFIEKRTQYVKRAKSE